LGNSIRIVIIDVTGKRIENLKLWENGKITLVQENFLKTYISLRNRKFLPKSVEQKSKLRV